MRNQAYDLFSRRIHRRARKRRFPLRVMFEITYRCNFNCLHCYIPEHFRKESEEKELKTRDVFFILDQLKDMGCLYLGFTGGEPFVREDFSDILRYAQAKGFVVIIYTNGALIDEDLAEVLKGIRPNKIDITVNSLKREPFERITRKSGSYDSVFKGIDLLYKRNIPLGFKSCLLSENKEELGDIEEFARVHRAPHRFGSMLMPRLDGSKEPYKYREREDGLIQAGASVKFYKAEGDLGTRQDFLTSDNLFFKCGAGTSQAAITPYGEMKLCLMMDYPKCQILNRDPIKSSTRQVTKTKNNLKKAWQRLKDFAVGIKSEGNYQNESRDLSDYYKRCPARVWLEDGRLKGYIPKSKK